MKPSGSSVGVIFGNRDFFPDHLVAEAHRDMQAFLQAMGVEAVMLGANTTKLGGVETHADARKCAALFREHRNKIASILVVTKPMEPIQSLLRRDLGWTPTELPGTDVAEVEYRALSWPHPRRLILLRHRVAERPGAGGKKLIGVPGYVFQALVTSLPASVPPLAVWRDYNGRADCENVIKELQQGFALPTLSLRSFWATEAALSLATLTDNLTMLFQRHLGWQTKVTIHSLRFWLFVTPGILAHPAGKTTIKLAVPPRERDWWSRPWQKILSPFPNCNAVENRPAFTA
jgi:hypothetical protein